MDVIYNRCLYKTIFRRYTSYISCWWFVPLRVTVTIRRYITSQLTKINLCFAIAKYFWRSDEYITFVVNFIQNTGKTFYLYPDRHSFQHSVTHRSFSLRNVPKKCTRATTPWKISMHSSRSLSAVCSLASIN